MIRNVSTRAKALFTTFALCALNVAPSWAATQTVTLLVPGTTCAACPFTVRTSLSKVKGMSKTEVILDKREARVSFDEASTSVQTLMKATGDAGYPSTVKN